MKLNSNVEILEDDGGVWLIFRGREHEFIYKADARRLEKWLGKTLKKKTTLREKRQRQ